MNKVLIMADRRTQVRSAHSIAEVCGYINNMDLIVRLLTVALQGIAEANTGSPFWNKSQAFSSYNGARRLITAPDRALH